MRTAHSSELLVETNNRNAKIIAYVTGMIAIVLGIFIYINFLIKYKKEKRQNYYPAAFIQIKFMFLF